MDFLHSKPIEVEDYPVGGEIVIVRTDEECISYLLRQVQQDRESLNAFQWKSQLASLHPSELPRCFLALELQWGVPPMTQQQTSSEIPNPAGQWEEEKLVAVMDSACRYVGVKKILKFQPHAGKKMDINDYKTSMNNCWIMIQYHKLRKEGSDLFIEEKVTLCKVYSANKLQDLDKWLNSSDYEDQLVPSEEHLMELCEEANNFLNGSEHPDGDNVPRAGCRSEVWNYFTKIYVEQTDDKDLKFAVCHICGRVLQADSKKIGTRTLWGHRDTHAPAVQKKRKKGGAVDAPLLPAAKQ